MTKLIDLYLETDLDVATVMKDARVAEQPRLEDAPLVEQVGYRVCILQCKCTDACKHTHCQHHHRQSSSLLSSSFFKVKII